MKVILLDRDGVINRYPGDTKYVTKWEEFHFLPQAKKAIAQLYQNRFKIFVISNQAGVGKGIFSQKTLDIITKNMLLEIERAGGKIEAIYYCTHKPDQNCSCRKPKTGLIDLAINQLKDHACKINLSNSYFIGDTIRDIEAGKKAGLKTILVFSGKERPENKNNWQALPDFTAHNLSEAVDLILK